MLLCNHSKENLNCKNYPAIRRSKEKNIMKIRTLISTIIAAAVMTAVGTVSAFAQAGSYTISGSDIKAAFDKSGTSTMAYVTFKDLGSYELQFNFKLSSGITKTYTVISNRTKDYTAYVPMQDMLDRLKFTAADITDLTVNGPSVGDVTAISLSLSAPTNVVTTSAGTANNGDENPATGSEAPLALLALTGLSGAVAFGSLKLRNIAKNK